MRFDFELADIFSKKDELLFPKDGNDKSRIILKSLGLYRYPTLRTPNSLCFQGIYLVKTFLPAALPFPLLVSQNLVVV